MLGKESGGGWKGCLITSILQSREMRLREVKNLAEDAQRQSAAQTQVCLPAWKGREGAMWRWWQEALRSGQAGGRCSLAREAR